MIERDIEEHPFNGAIMGYMGMQGLGMGLRVWSLGFRDLVPRGPQGLESWRINWKLPPVSPKP